MLAEDFAEADREYRRYMRDRQWKLESHQFNDSQVSKCDSKKAFTLTKYRQAKVSSGALPEVHDRPHTAPAGKVDGILGYTGHRPRKSFSHAERAVSPLKVKIFGYTGHIPSKVLDQQELEASSRLPICKHKCGGVKRVPTPEERELTKQKYDRNLVILEKRGQTAEGILNIVQNKLQERVTSSAQQQIHLSRMFEYFDFDNSQTLEENEFKMFLEHVNCFLDEVQFLAMFALFDTDFSSGISWAEFKRYAMVSNPRGGTAILPKATISSYGDRRIRCIQNIKVPS